jgi:hypothetical protein
MPLSENIWVGSFPFEGYGYGEGVRKGDDFI